MENLMQAGGLPSKFQAGKGKKGNALKMKDYNDAPKLYIEVRGSQRHGEKIFLRSIGLKIPFMFKILAVGYPWSNILVDTKSCLESEMSEFNLRGDGFSDVGP